MVTNAEPVEEVKREERVAQSARVIIAGHPQGAVRRIILYALLGTTTLGGIALGPPLGFILGSIALIALLLLAMTDQLA